jgi:hypothetical protein
VLELLPRQQHIRPSPAFSLLTRRMCICKRWVRLMTAREPPHSDLTVTCLAQHQYHLAVSHLVVLHRYQPLVPPSHLYSKPVHRSGTDETRPKSESLCTICTRGPQIQLSRPVSKCSLSIQYRFGVACEKVEEREYSSCPGSCVSASERKSANRHRPRPCSETLTFSPLPIVHTANISHWARLAQ